jgi:hypothetical protein
VKPDSPVAITFKPVLDQIRPAYTRADFDVPIGIHHSLDLSPLNASEVSPLRVEFGQDWENPILDPGKADPLTFQWVSDFQSLIERNKDDLRTALQTHGPHMQERLEEMADRMKNIWRAAKDDQKAQWNEVRRQTFGTDDLSTKLLDVVC